MISGIIHALLFLEYESYFCKNKAFVMWTTYWPWLVPESSWHTGMTFSFWVQTVVCKIFNRFRIVQVSLTYNMTLQSHIYRYLLLHSFLNLECRSAIYSVAIYLKAKGKKMTKFYLQLNSSTWISTIACCVKPWYICCFHVYNFFISVTYVG